MVTVVKHPTTGNVITPSAKNPDWGTIRVDSTNKSFKNGVFNLSKRTAFINGEIANLETLGLTDGKRLPGKIQMQESFEPFYEGQDPKINPSTGQAVLKNGQLTYMQYEYVEDENAPDIWVENTPAEVAENVQEALAEQAV